MVTMLKRRGATLTAGPAKLATTANKRTRGGRWQTICRRIMERDGGLCVYCAPFGHVSIGVEVDHRRPLWAGGTDSDANLATTCAAHHRAKTRAEERDRETGAAWSPWQPERLPG
jgi:5-methylcytosine-specific restriction protein A